MGLAEAEAFWTAALAGDVRRVAWLSRRSAPEYCGFLEWLWRLGDLPCEIVDLTDTPVGNHRRAFSLALLNPGEVAANAVWDRAKALDAITRSQYHRLWRRLRLENAPLRVVDSGGLRRCVVPAAGYYEWKTINGAKQPFYFSAEDGGVLSIAGWWDEWNDRSSSAGPLLSCTLIVTAANEFAGPDSQPHAGLSAAERFCGMAGRLSTARASQARQRRAASGLARIEARQSPRQ
jgi:hypothetical protein